MPTPMRHIPVKYHKDKSGVWKCGLESGDDKRCQMSWEYTQYCGSEEIYCVFCQDYLDEYDPSCLPMCVAEIEKEEALIKSVDHLFSGLTNGQA